MPGPRLSTAADRRSPPNDSDRLRLAATQRHAVSGCIGNDRVIATLVAQDPGSAKRLSWEDLLPRPHGAPCSQNVQTDLLRCRVRVGFGWVLSCRRARADGPW